MINWETAISLLYAPRRTLCVPDNALSLAVICIEIVFEPSERSSSFGSYAITISENRDVVDEFTVTLRVKSYAGEIT